MGWTWRRSTRWRAGASSTARSATPSSGRCRSPSRWPPADAIVGTIARLVTAHTTRIDHSYRGLLRVPLLSRVLASMMVARVAQAMVGVAIVLFTLDQYDSPAL